MAGMNLSHKVEMHDLGNLLVRLELYTQKGDLCKLKETTPEIISCYRRLRKSYTVTQSNKLVKTSLDHLIEEFNTDKMRIEKSYDIKINILNNCQKNTYFWSFSAHLQHLHINIIQNAAKAGATFMILECQSTDNTMSIFYRDNGRGMSEQTLKEIGFGFTTTGGGEGVSLMRKMMCDLSGEINWSSIPGIGTQVELKVRKCVKD